MFEWNVRAGGGAAAGGDSADENGASGEAGLAEGGGEVVPGLDTGLDTGLGSGTG